MNEEVTVALIIAALIDSRSFMMPFLPEILANRAPAKESPHPVGSTSSLSGYDGRDIIPVSYTRLTLPTKA